ARPSDGSSRSPRRTTCRGAPRGGRTLETTERRERGAVLGGADWRHGVARQVPLPSPLSPVGHNTPARPPPAPSPLLPRVRPHQLSRSQHVPLHGRLHVPLP